MSPTVIIIFDNKLINSNDHSAQGATGNIHPL